jgi:3-oxoacyl-[acyl-carrier-protein] synthase-1
MPVNVIKELRTAKLGKCLKTASGFGGCNAAIILENLN